MIVADLPVGMKPWVDKPAWLWLLHLTQHCLIPTGPEGWPAKKSAAISTVTEENKSVQLMWVRRKHKQLRHAGMTGKFINGGHLHFLLQVGRAYLRCYPGRGLEKKKSRPFIAYKVVLQIAILSKLPAACLCYWYWARHCLMVTGGQDW